MFQWLCVSIDSPWVCRACKFFVILGLREPALDSFFGWRGTERPCQSLSDHMCKSSTCLRICCELSSENSCYHSCLKLLYEQVTWQIQSCLVYSVQNRNRKIKEIDHICLFLFIDQQLSLSLETFVAVILAIKSWNLRELFRSLASLP